MSVGGQELSDDEMEKIWYSQYKLDEFNAPEFFKSYDDLKARFEKVTGETVTPSDGKPMPPLNDPSEPTPTPKQTAASSPAVSAAVGEDLSFFEKLANQP